MSIKMEEGRSLDEHFNKAIVAITRLEELHYNISKASLKVLVIYFIDQGLKASRHKVGHEWRYVYLKYT